MANRSLQIGCLVAVLVICITSIGLYPLARDSFSRSQIQELIEPEYNRHRPGGGRLSESSYVLPVDESRPVEDLGTAQILLLRHPDSEDRKRLQGQVYLAAGDWQKFVDLNRSAEPSDRQTVNNLGASFLALGDKDPSLFLKALDAFEHASRLDPKAPEPFFNLVVTYRKLHFTKLADEALHRYAELDNRSQWYRELSDPVKIDEAAIADDLARAVEGNNSAESEHLFETNPELCRRLVLGHAVYGEQESEPLLRFIVSEMEKRYQDKTFSAMLFPLLNEQRETTRAVRELVNQGATLYTHGSFPESLAAYNQAENLAAKTGSEFDKLWIDLNRVDTQIRLGEIDVARRALSNLVASAQAHGYVWLTAKALSLYGSTVKLTANYTEMIDLLSRADRMFIDIDAPHDRLRVLYYLASYRYFAGDHEEALRFALQSLRLVADNDSSRIYTLDWLIGSILYRQGLSEQAVMFAKESVDQSQIASNAAAEASTATSLARIYESTSQFRLAEQYLQIGATAFQKIPKSFDRDKSEMLLGLVQARVDLDEKKYADAEALLKRNLEILSRQPFAANDLLAQILMLSAQVYSETGRIAEAARKFNEAIDGVENDSQNLNSEQLRVKFDDERRELYDSAIEFEFNNGSPDAAWSYLQKYRAKLFLEFLAAFNPNIEETRAKSDRASVQHRIPKDTQIIEYSLLKDRLLIWLMTDTLFTVRSVPIKRADLESEVETVLKKLRFENDADLLLTELGRQLIEPVGSLLDPNKTLVVIPDRALNGLPFSAIRRPGRNQYLIQEFPIIESPTLTHFLASNAHTEKTPRDSIVGFGSQNGGASELKELNALKGIYASAKLYAGPQVDKPAFLTAINKAAIFHYAGHSATDAVDPLRSSILLDGNRSGPNSVTAVDISRQRLPGNAVVILSSCDSSVGNSRDGIGVRGLTSAFLIGGAGAVVGSLWPVEATSTADLMIRFHRSFAQSHMPVTQALREAQLSFLQSSSGQAHPYYWSGFVVTGNFSALR